jgi:hypothetical protein
MIPTIGYFNCALLNVMPTHDEYAIREFVWLSGRGKTSVVGGQLEKQKVR